jgi:hypothetical protein
VHASEDRPQDGARLVKQKLQFSCLLAALQWRLAMHALDIRVSLELDQLLEKMTMTGLQTARPLAAVS